MNSWMLRNQEQVSLMFEDTRTVCGLAYDGNTQSQEQAEQRHNKSTQDSV